MLTCFSFSGYSDVGCFGSEIKTPHIDKLAAEGARFTDCTSRSIRITGNPNSGILQLILTSTFLPISCQSTPQQPVVQREVSSLHASLLFAKI